MRAKYIEKPEQWAAEFHFFVEVQVRFSETDMYGHMNNTVPFTYFELARIEYLKHTNLMNWSDPSSDAILVVADLQCDFLQQVFFDEKVKVYVKADSIGSSSMDVHYLAKNEKGQPVFTGRSAIVQISKTTGKGLAWTEQEKEILLGK